jgi:hypothetical protein
VSGDFVELMHKRWLDPRVVEVIGRKHMRRYHPRKTAEAAYAASGQIPARFRAQCANMAMETDGLCKTYHDMLSF